MRAADRMAVGYTSAGHLLCHGAKMALPILLAPAAAGFGVSLTAMAVPVSAFTLAMGLASLPAGLLADRFGAARVLTAYAWLTAAGAALCWAAPGLVSFTVAHALLGAAAGLFHPAGLALLSLSVERRSRGMAMGIHGMFGPLGMAITPIVVLFLARRGDWRAAYAGLSAACAALALASHWLRARGMVPDAPRERLADGESGSVSSAQALLLVAVVGVNAFLLDGFSVMFPETIARHGVFVWDLDTVLFAILGVGALGQFIGGMLARGERDARLYLLVVAAQPVILLVTGSVLASPVQPFFLLSAFAFFNFMTQPIENSLLAGFTARARHSTAYALKFLVGLVIGAPAPIVGVAVAERHGFAAAWTVFGVIGLLAVLLAVLFRRAEARARSAVAAPR